MNSNDTLQQLKRAAILQRLQQTRRPEAPPAQGIRPADRTQPLPLSLAQQRLWFIDQLERAGGGACHMPVGLRLQGALDRRALKAGLDRIVFRHD